MVSDFKFYLHISNFLFLHHFGITIFLIKKYKKQKYSFPRFLFSERLILTDLK